MHKRKSEESGSENEKSCCSSDEGGKSLVESKIKRIIEANFDEEINYKKQELEKINQRIFEAQNMLDKLRVCIICNFYSLNGRLSLSEYANHPAISELKCEHIDAAICHSKPSEANENDQTFNYQSMLDSKEANNINNNNHITYTQQYEIKICVGNVSKYLKTLPAKSSLTGPAANNCTPRIGQISQTAQTGQTGQIGQIEHIANSVDSSQYNQDLITHKWMVYIRSPNCSKLDNYIKKVIFYLHSSYKPHDTVQVKNAPFQIIRRGWGEFPVHVQIHFKDSRNKRVDLNHHLKLDWTQTGLQTFGGETSLTTKLVLKPNDYIFNKSEGSSTSSNSNININSNAANSSTNSAAAESINSTYLIDPINRSDHHSETLVDVDCRESNENAAFQTTANNNFESPGESMQNRVDSMAELNASSLSSLSLSSSSKTAQNQAETTNANNNNQQTANANLTSNINDLFNLRPKSINLNKVNPILNLVKASSLSAPSSSNNPNKELKAPIVLTHISTLSTQQPPNQQSQPQSTKTAANVSSSSSNLNKCFVIYKVESGDVKKVADFSSVQATTSQLVQQQRPPTTGDNNAPATIALNKKIKLTCDQLTKVKASLSSKVSAEQPAEQRAGKENDNQKCSQTCTLVSNENAILEEFAQSKSAAEKTEEVQTIQVKKEPVIESAVDSKYELIYSVEYLIEKLNKLKENEPIVLNENITFESFIKLSLNNFPIISGHNSHNISNSYNSNSHNINSHNSNINVNKHKRAIVLPFSASSIHEYYSWPYAKRKAKEWTRAVYVKRKCIQLLNNLNSYFKTNSAIEVWSTKQILLWLRSHGYTPLEYKHMLIGPTWRERQSETESETKSEVAAHLDYVSSYSPINTLFDYKNIRMQHSTLKPQQQDSSDEMDEVEIVDVIASNQPSRHGQTKAAERRRSNTTGLDYDHEMNSNNSNYIQMCPGSLYVKEQLDKINIKTNTVNLVASFESPNESNVYKCHLVELFMLQLCKRFANDLIRQACADIYFDSSYDKSTLHTAPSNPNSTSNNSYNSNEANTNAKKPAGRGDLSAQATSGCQANNAASLQYQKFPESLGVRDIFNTIVKHDKYDFLTNKYMSSYDCDALQLNQSLLDPNNIGNIGNNNNNNTDTLDNNLKYLNSKNKPCNLKKNFSDSHLINK